MNFLPVMTRELRVASRRSRTYYARSFAALVVALMSLGMLSIGFGGLLRAATAGRNLFVALSVLAYFYVLLDGPFMTSDCLSQEKREGTMGLLFLTDLSGWDIIAGKFVSRSANSAYCLLAALPTLGIGIFLGGVTGSNLFQMMLALINALFFSLSFGMLVSALCRNERSALQLALSGVLFLGVVVPLLGMAVSHLLNTASVHPAFLIAGPAGAFLSALRSGWGGMPSYSFTASIFIPHLMSWMFLALASTILPHAWQDQPAQRSWARGSGLWFPQVREGWRWFFSMAGSHGSRRDGRRPIETDRMMPGSARRWAQKGLGIWSVLLLLGTLGIAAYLFGPKNWFDLPAYAGSAVVVHLILMYAVAAQACRGPAEDRRTGVLELLLTTPLGEDLFLRGGMLSLKRRCAGPVLFVLGADVIFIVLGCLRIAAFNWASIGWVAFFLLLMAKLLVDLYTLSWVGFWQGLKAKNITGAIRQTIYYGCLLRWLILLGAVAFFGLATQGSIFKTPAAGVLLAAGYALLEVMTVLTFCGVAMSELKDDLRWLVAQHEETGGARFSWLPFHFERVSGRVQP